MLCQQHIDNFKVFKDFFGEHHN